MSSSPAPSPPRYPNPCIQENSQAIETLKKQISKEIKGSYAFTGGRQERDERFQKLFTEFFKELRGAEPLVNETAQVMADRFIERPDISYSRHLCEGFNSPIEYYPSPELVKALESIIEKEYGLQEQFLEALASNGRQLSALELKDRDTQYRDYYVVCRLFPTCLGTLRAIFKDLLIVEWLRQDSGQGRLVLADTEAISSLWQEAKQLAEQQKATDAKLSERHWRDFKTDLYQTASSGALSLYTKKPHFVVGQVAKTAMNVIGRQVDPHGQSKVLKGFSLLSSALVSKRLGGNTGDLVKSLGVDVVELSQRSENTSKEKDLLRGYASALAKGALTLDKKKLTSQILGFVTSTVANDLPEAESSETYRALRATATNPDIHGCIIDKGVERYFKVQDKPKESTNERLETEQLQSCGQGGVLLSKPVYEANEEKEPFQAFEDQWLEDILNESLSHVSVEKAQEIGQNLDRAREQINQIDEVIKIGTQHLNNLEMSGEHVEYIDDAKYEVRQRSNHWRVYRNGKTIYKEPTWKSKAKDTCKQKIPELKKQYGTAIPTQAFTEAKKALDRASIEKSSLLETKESLQQQLPESMLHVEYEKDLAEYNRQVEEYGKQVEHCQAINQAVEGINEKQGIVKYRGSRLEDRLEKLQKEPHKKSVREKADNEVTKYNNANADLDTAINHYNALTGNNERVSTKKMKKPKKPSWDARLSSKLRAMGVESANVSTSVPLYPTTPSTRTTYAEMQHQVNLARSELEYVESTQSQSRGSRGNWGEVQNFQNQQIFQENMSFRSAQQAQGTAQHEISRHSADMGLLWGNGVARNVQPPPVSTRQAIESGIREAITTRHNPIMEMSGVAPFVLSKVIPKRTQEKVKTWITDYIQEIKNDPIQARKDLDVAVILGAKKAVVVALQAFEQPSLKQRPNTYGLMEASNRFDRWVAGKVNVNLDSRNAQVGMFVGEIFAPMGMCKTARPVMKVGQEAIQFIRSTQRARPLVDRVLLSPQNFGRELRSIQAMQNPVHRSGLVGEKAVQQARKAVNLPSWKKVDIWMDHIASGHTGNGWRTGCKGSNKSLFPEGMTKQQIETAIRQAYRNGKKVRTQNATTVIVRGEHQGLKLEMFVNTESKIIETAYPKQWIE